MFFPHNKRVNKNVSTELTDSLKKKSNSLSVRGRGFSHKGKSTESPVKIPAAGVMCLPGDPSEKTALSSSASKRLGMSRTANDGIYVIHCALPRPCTSFLDED